MKGLLLFSFTAIQQFSFITFCCIRHTVAQRKYSGYSIRFLGNRKAGKAGKTSVEWARGAQIDVAACQSMLEMIEMIADE